MVILLHVIIALLNVGASTWLLFKPSKRMLTITYVLLSMTVISGTYLIFSMPSHMVQTCTEGLIYVAFVLGEIAIAKRRLAHKKLISGINPL